MDFLDERVWVVRRRIAELGALMFDRKLTDASGGNLSARAGEYICITPRYSGQKHYWRLKPEDVLVVDRTGQVLAGAGSMSREAKVHLRMLNQFKMANGVAHAHPVHALVFCVARKPLPPILESTRKYGVIEVLPEYAVAHGEQLSDLVYQAMLGKTARIEKHAAVVMARWHGLFAVGNSLEAVIDAVERVDVSAGILLQSGGNLETALKLAEQWHRELEQDVANATL